MGTKPPLSNKNRTFIYEIYYEMSLLFEMPRTCKDNAETRNRDNYKSMGAKPNHLKERVNISKQGYILLLF